MFRHRVRSPWQVKSYRFWAMCRFSPLWAVQVHPTITSWKNRFAKPWRCYWMSSSHPVASHVNASFRPPPGFPFAGPVTTGSKPLSRRCAGAAAGRTCMSGRVITCAAAVYYNRHCSPWPGAGRVIRTIPMGLIRCVGSYIGSSTAGTHPSASPSVCSWGRPAARGFKHLASISSSRSRCTLGGCAGEDSTNPCCWGSKSAGSGEFAWIPLC